MTLDEAVVRMIAAQRSAGETVQPGAGPERTVATRTALREEFGAGLPEPYRALLHRCDGLDHDGLVLQGSAFEPALMERNRLWREAPGRDDVLVLGDTDVDLLVVSLDGTAPRLLDKVGGDVAETFPDVTTALVALLAARA